MENVSFITTERGDDIIVSFAIPVTDEFEVKSLTLLRTPKYEFILDESERGVTVSYDEMDDDAVELLEEVEIEGRVVKIKTAGRRYSLSLRDVDNGEIREMKEVLKEMNYDGRFKLRIAAADPPEKASSD